MTQHIPKAELHVHLDGTLTPQLIQQLARKHGLSINKEVLSQCGQYFYWRDFSGFHAVFEEVFKVIQDASDLELITYYYLKTLAQQNTHYAELIVSPYHAQNNGLSYHQILQGLQVGIDQAREAFGIEGRVLMVFLRHYGPAQAEELVQTIVNHPHPYVVGVNLVGDIRQYEVKAFQDCFALAKQAGLGLSCHAGELDGGVHEIWQAVEDLQVDRVSHGVRCLEDPALVKVLVERQIHLEVCPTSNVVLGMYPNYQQHPFIALHKAGLNLGLNTDDPGFFNTTINNEYQIAQKYYAMSDAHLRQMSYNAMQASFLDKSQRQQLLQHCFM